MGRLHNECKIDTRSMCLLLVGLFLMVSALPAFAKRTAGAFERSLARYERTQFAAWYKAQVFFDAAMDAYWAKVETKRRVRRSKRRKSQAFLDQDYVTEYPPTFDGPKISKSLLKRWRDYRKAGKSKSSKSNKGLPGLDVYFASAKRYFKFSPERIPEIEFKRRYAKEALAQGLTKDQVVRVYALETGGRGTADMQAGINPITRKGKPISSALGYAQLLAANSINVLAKHGPKFNQRLSAMVGKEKDAARRARLRSKLTVLRQMVRTAKSVPYKWSRHIAFSKTGRGRALHVMNMDGVVGPWMQVVKLADLKLLAERKGRAKLSGAEIELMNLAGPSTGLEMMRVTGLDKPTTNFFSRRAYYRNTVVRGKDSRGLLGALEERMQFGIKQKGAQEFVAVFNELLGAQRAKPRVLPPIRAFGFAPGVFNPKN